MSNYRNPTILALAQHAPHCMHCGSSNHGEVVACHSNSLRHGKGTGIKAHDVPAYLCRGCHDLLDGRAGTLTRHEKDVMFLDAAYDSIVWLLQEGHLKVCK